MVLMKDKTVFSTLLNLTLVLRDEFAMTVSLWFPKPDFDFLGRVCVRIGVSPDCTYF